MYIHTYTKGCHIVLGQKGLDVDSYIESVRKSSRKILRTGNKR